ncbi:MAG: hypothetical protein V3T05_00975 [Myxococcota bacterium]
MRIAGTFLVVTIATFVTTSAMSSAQAGVFNEIAGVRSLAMGGAHRGIGSSNDTLYLNPAGMAIGRRYAVEFNYGNSPFDRLSDRLTHLNVSAVDSSSGPVAGGFGYTHTRGNSDGVDTSLHRIYVAAAYPIMRNMAFGVTYKHIRGTLNHAGQKREVSMSNYDAGLAIHLGQGIGIGLSAHNIIRTAKNKSTLIRLVPLTFGGGLAWNLSPITVGADVVVDARNTDELVYSYHAGVEYFLQNQFPLRMGFRRVPYKKPTDGTLHIENIVTGGAAWVNAGGALAVAFERSLERHKNWSLIVALKFFI